MAALLDIITLLDMTSGRDVITEGVLGFFLGCATLNCRIFVLFKYGKEQVSVYPEQAHLSDREDCEVKWRGVS